MSEEFSFVAATVLFFGACAGVFFWMRDGCPFDPRWLPAVLVVIDVLAAIGYAYAGGMAEWRKVVYWLAAATLTTTVTW